MVAKKKTEQAAAEKPAGERLPTDEEKLNEVLTPAHVTLGYSSVDSLAIELKKAREAKTLSFSDLSRLTGISRTSLHDYESGRSKPGAKELVRLCEVLEVTPNRLLLGSDNVSAPEGGVLVALSRMAKAKPAQAIAFSAFFLPYVAGILTNIGQESLTALATLADETLRARDPETYRRLSLMVAELQEIDLAAYLKMPPEEQQKMMADLSQRFERMVKTM